MPGIISKGCVCARARVRRNHEIGSGETDFSQDGSERSKDGVNTVGIQQEYRQRKGGEDGANAERRCPSLTSSLEFLSVRIVWLEYSHEN